MAKDDVVREWDRPPPPETLGKVTGQVIPHTHPEGLPTLGVKTRYSDYALDVADADTLSDGGTERAARIRHYVTVDEILGSGWAEGLYVPQVIQLDHTVTQTESAAIHGEVTAKGSSGINATSPIIAGVFGEATWSNSSSNHNQPGFCGVAARVSTTDGDETVNRIGAVMICEPSIVASSALESHGLYIDRQHTSNATTVYAIEVESGTVELNTQTNTDSDFIVWSNNKRLVFLDASADAIHLGDTAGTDYATFASDGELTLTGTARVTVDMYITASGVKAPGSKPATFIEQGLCGAWQFADAVLGNEESVSGTLKLPSQMDKTEVPVFKVGWSANGVSPGNCYWQLEYLYRSPGEDTTAAAQETLYATGTASSTSDGLVITSFSGIDLPSATDQAMFFRITRMSAHANDTISDTVELLGMLFTHTRDKLGTAT